MTMDILWAISNPPAHSLTASPPPSPPSLPATDSYFDLPELPRGTPKRTSLATLRRLSSQPYGLYSPPQPINAARSLSATLPDPTAYDPDDYAVGGIMHWGYALASGSADGCVRMWDMRTGQAHRTLVGHVAPVSCLQFDEFHLVSGSLDKSIRIWDLRTGTIADTVRYDHPVTALQFDSRKIVAACGENGVKVRPGVSYRMASPHRCAGLQPHDIAAHDPHARRPHQGGR
jgi:division protein 1